MHWYLAPLRRYADFRGRARPAEFWSFAAMNAAAWFALSVAADAGRVSDGVALLAVLYAIALLVPAFALAVRRLHDTGRRGWWVLIALVPYGGAMALLGLMAQDGQPGANAYGPDPRALPA